MYIKGKSVFNTAIDAKTTAEYVVARLVDLGITDCFAVPGDFSFSLDHALVNNKKLKYIGCSNELNASYAADGYARERGAAILSTTYAVGELSAMNGVMGAKAENNIIFHLVGIPTEALQIGHKQVHHSLGNGVFGNFFDLSAATACVSGVIRPDNAVMEMDRIIHEVFRKHQPAYIAIALDLGFMPLSQYTIPSPYVANYVSNQKRLEQAINLCVEKIVHATEIIILPSLKLARWGVVDKALQVIEKIGVPFAIMPHDKAVISETHAQYLGYYCGSLSDNGVAEIIEKADLILDLGLVLWSDFNSGAFSAKLDRKKFLTIAPTYVRYQDAIFNEVYIEEFLDTIVSQLPRKANYINQHRSIIKTSGIADTKLTLDCFYTRMIDFIRPNDILVVETGSTSLHFPSLTLPVQVSYHNQTLWGSIGWATPATLGIALASPNRRVILITGEGSHQMTANEIGTMSRYGVKPIIICINNDGYVVERGLEADPDWEYDDIAKWEYSKLPEALGCCNWLSKRVTTNIELDIALKEAENINEGVYIELIIGKYDYNKTLQFYNNRVNLLHGGS